MKKYLLFTIISCSTLNQSQASNSFETYGDIGQFAIPVIAASISWYKDDYEGLKDFGYSFLATTATVEVLKNTVDATRPNGGSKSFPSGHTAWAFSGASYLHMRYGWDYGLPAYIAAGAVGWSRVDSDNHYWRDVVASAVIASGFSYFFTTPYEQKLAFAPGIMFDGSQGILMNYQY